MKRNIFIYLSALFLIFSCKNPAETPINRETPSSTEISNVIFFEEKPIISAHRAGKGIANYPENCLETMQYLMTKGISSFEIDIFETLDGHLMLMHDHHLGRTSTGQGKVSQMYAKELEKEYLIDDFRTLTNFRIPYLKDVLVWAKKNKASLMLDFKKGISYQKTIDMVRSQKMENQVVLISYSVSQAKELHAIAPEMLISVSARNENELDKILQTNIPKHKMVAFTGTMLSSEKLFQRLASLKIPAILGTLGNLDKKAAAQGDILYKQWADMGVQIFSTDRPLEAKHVFN